MCCIVPSFEYIFASSNQSKTHKNKKMKKLLITIIALSALVLPNLGFTQTEKEPVLTPAYIQNGEVIPVVTLPEVTIHATEDNSEMTGYTLPEVTITSDRTPDNVYPAVLYHSEYIASVNLKPIDIVAKQKRVTLASLFSLKWLFHK